MCIFLKLYLHEIIIRFTYAVDNKLMILMIVPITIILSLVPVFIRLKYDKCEYENLEINGEI